MFVCSFVRLFVRSFVRSFVLPSVAWNLRQSFALKFLKWCISQQLLIRKHSYLDHSYPGGLAFTPWPRTPGSMPPGGARGQNLGHLKSVFSKFCYGFLEVMSWEPLIRKHSYLDHRYPVGLAFIPWHRIPGSMPGGGARGQNLVHLKQIGFLC